MKDYKLKQRNLRASHTLAILDNINLSPPFFFLPVPKRRSMVAGTQLVARVRSVSICMQLPHCKDQLPHYLASSNMFDTLISPDSEHESQLTAGLFFTVSSVGALSANSPSFDLSILSVCLAEVSLFVCLSVWLSS